MTTTEHERHMRSAIQEAKKNPSAPFGTVIVDGTDGRLVASGYNRGFNNPVLHGEMVALLALERRTLAAKDLALYTTAEPCPMCASAALWAGIRSVYYGVSIHWLAAQGWRQIDIDSAYCAARASWQALRITGDVLRADCERLFGLAR